MRNSVLITDIDGTIACNVHRQHYLKGDKKDWESFYNEMGDDIPYSDTISLIESFAKRYELDIVFITGRSEKYRDLTHQWIKKFFEYPPTHMTVLMRKDKDFRPAHQIKEEYLKRLQTKCVILGVFEDDDKCVQMYRKNGVTCYQCRDSQEEFSTDEFIKES
jgi:acid phosphatase class B